MNKKILALFILCSLIGCNDNCNLTVRFPNADGLSTYTQVTLNGLKIGQVSNLKLDDNKTILASVVIDGLRQIPTDTKFILRSDFLGNGTIDLELGHSSEFLKNGEIIEGTKSQIENQGSDIINDVFNLSKKSTQDSILFELRRLNENIEKLLNKK